MGGVCELWKGGGCPIVYVRVFVFVFVCGWVGGLVGDVHHLACCWQTNCTPVQATRSLSLKSSNRASNSSFPNLPDPQTPGPLAAAIADPATNNKTCLDTLLATVFVNTGASQRTLHSCAGQSRGGQSRGNGAACCPSQYPTCTCAPYNHACWHSSRAHSTVNAGALLAARPCLQWMLLPWP